jgi:ribosomal protein S18 acetylase RimI-like enzyme
MTLAEGGDVDPAIDLRQVRSGDLDFCDEIEASCFPADERASRERIAKRIQVFPEGFLVAVVGGRLVGLIMSVATTTGDLADEELKDMVGHDPHGENLVVVSVAVRPEFQGRQIGRKLVIELAARARAEERKRVLLLCKADLISFYEKLGFRDQGESASTHGGSRWHEMRRML